MRDFSRHADGFAQRRVWVNRLADVDRVGAHLDRQGHFADHVARVGADHATAQNLAVAVCFGRVIKQQLGDAFVASVGNRAPRGIPGEQALFDLDALRLGLVLGETHPGHFGVGVGHRWNHARIEGRTREFLVALDFTGDHFGGHMRFMHRLVSEHGLAHDVANGEDVGHVGAHLDVDVDEAAISHGHAGLVGGDLLAIGRAAHRLYDAAEVKRSHVDYFFSPSAARIALSYAPASGKLVGELNAICTC